MSNWTCDKCNCGPKENVVKVEFRLSDGSALVTGMHRDCAKEIDENNFADLYANICARWEEELRQSSMSEDKKQSVRDKYYGCHIKRLIGVS